MLDFGASGKRRQEGGKCQGTTTMASARQFSVGHLFAFNSL